MNKNNVYSLIGASNHSLTKREGMDYYATQPKAAELLLEVETFSPNIWECACGEKHLSKVLEAHGYNVRNSDIMNRCNNEVKDFLGIDNITEWQGDIVTNPPYCVAEEFVRKALSLIPKGNKVAMFLRLLFLEGKARKQLFKIAPPRVVYVSSSRLLCAMNGDFEHYKSVAQAYGWFVWEKGYTGETIVKWIN